MNFRGVGWAKGRKGCQSTGDPSRKGLGEVAGGAGVDDADADVAEGLEKGVAVCQMGRREGEEEIGRGGRGVGGKR